MGEYNGIKVDASAMDQIAGAICAGVVEKGIISETTGTTMAIFVPIDEIPEYDENGITALECKEVGAAGVAAITGKAIGV